MSRPDQRLTSISNRLSPGELAGAFSLALRESRLTVEDTAVLFYDLDHLQARVQGLQQAFPSKTVHTAAVKANPLRRILDRLVGWGLGLEVASWPEVQMALRLGATETRHVTYNSPARTEGELRDALRLKIAINLDSLEELDRLAEILTSEQFVPGTPIGLRINPQVGSGRILTTGVASSYSKFGVPIAQADSILAAFQRCPWLDAVHVHIGSQGIDLPMLVEGTARVFDLACLINDTRADQPIRWFNLGGGLPVQYLSRQSVPAMSEYAAALRERCPTLFTDAWTMITEFGRYLHTNAGWVATLVEAVKPFPDKSILITHVGADLCLRECYDRPYWPHEVAVTDPQGHLKTDSRQQLYDVAGPLCFAGDFPIRDVWLPAVQPGDWLLLRDMGAYTYSMWSRYNSRAMPQVIGYRQGESGLQFETLKQRESLESVLATWE